MELTERKTLASIRNEAERQSDFYRRKGEHQLENDWAIVGELATLAIQHGGCLLIEKRENHKTLIPIKGCEQVQQPPINNVIKAFR